MVLHAVHMAAVHVLVTELLVGGCFVVLALPQQHSRSIPPRPNTLTLSCTLHAIPLRVAMIEIQSSGMKL